MTAAVVDELLIDRDAHRVTQHGTTVELTPREYSLLSFLEEHAGHAFSRDELLASVWDAKRSYLDIGTVTVHMRRLRLKLESDPNAPSILMTVRGQGYRFDPPGSLGTPTTSVAARSMAARRGSFDGDGAEDVGARRAGPCGSSLVDSREYRAAALQARPHLQRTGLLRAIADSLG